VFRSLLGSRMLVANLEVRAPIPGMFTGEIEYGRFPIDLAFFADAGLTWRSDDRPEFAGGTRRPVRSVGAAFRTNLFGLIALEISASRPFDRADNQIRWQIGIRQGF
jgi:outer membrane protein assembly factor BamA